MICQCCIRIFELGSDFVPRREPAPHHVNTQSLVLSALAGCPICRAIISELDDPQVLFSNPNIVSSTECSLRDLRWASDQTLEGHFPFYYYLHFTWKSPGVPQRYRGFVIEQYQKIRPYLSTNALKAHRGWTSQTRQMLKTWVHNCCELHPKCQVLNIWRTSGTVYQPKRLVDIGCVGNSTWRLILREDNKDVPVAYATISHRWSTGQQLKLVAQNVQLYTKGQPLDLLPPVFQDAIEVAKSLGIQYLWADCLCIIQDSLSDWEAESLEMCKIYTNSICNISVTGFEDNSTGFLDKICDYPSLPCRVRPNWAAQVDEGWFVLDPFFWWSQVTNAPLTKRGWVFQERFLAPRVIHFGPDQVLWECASLDACEAFPQGLPSIVESPRHTGFKRLDFLFEHDALQGRLLKPAHTLSIKEEDLLHHWCETIQAYTRTSLTKPKDKLIALAGVAQLMSLSNPAQHLLLMLEWHSDGQMFTRHEPAGARPPQYRAPSWSWASIDGRVFYDYLPLRIDDSQLWNRKTSWELYIERLDQQIRRPEISRQPIPRKCLGWKPLIFKVTSSILNGDLRLTGLLISSRDIITKSTYNPFLRPILVYWDAPTTLGQVEMNTFLLPLRCIQLGSSHKNVPFYWVTGLILKRVDADEYTYERFRELGIKLTECPFTATYTKDTKLETLRLI
ncbi:heterokaryon incompatibility protein-domain-containing protein [Xylaria arbuscula]|nr:heterokaryon incompatibility protein-domain-containing protein [Xylaria arbuscula]